MSDRFADGVKVSVLGGSAMFWVIPWPGSVMDYRENFKLTIETKLWAEDMFLIFDRYCDSKKCYLRI